MFQISHRHRTPWAYAKCLCRHIPDQSLLLDTFLSSCCCHVHTDICLRSQSHTHSDFDDDCPNQISWYVSTVWLLEMWMCYSWEQLEKNISLCCFPDEALNMQIIFSRCTSVSRPTVVCFVRAGKKMHAYSKSIMQCLTELLFSLSVSIYRFKNLWETGAKLASLSTLLCTHPRPA